MNLLLPTQNARPRGVELSLPRGVRKNFIPVGLPGRMGCNSCTYMEFSFTLVCVCSLMGIYPGAKMSTPAIPGLEGVGVVHAIGEGFDAVKVGERVVPLFIYGDEYLRAGKGSWADYVVFKASDVFPVPEGVPDETAAQVCN